MLILNIAGKRYKYLSRQSEITIRVAEQLQDLKKDYPCDCNPEYQRWVLTILCGCSYDEALLVDDIQLAKLIGVHPYFSNDILVAHHTYIKVRGKIFKYMDFDTSMTVETFGNLDFLAINDREFELYQALYEEVKRHDLKYYFRWIFLKNHRTWEDLNHFRKILAVNFYYHWKQGFLKTFNLGVGDDMLPEDRPDEYVLTSLEKYGIYHLIMELVGDDYDKQERWLKRDINELFKYLRYMNKKVLMKNLSIKNQ